MLDVDSKDKLKSSTLPSSKNRARSTGVGKSDTDLDDTTDEMMDMLVKTVTSNQSKSRVRRRERSSMANRKSRKIFHSRFLIICYFHDSLEHIVLIIVRRTLQQGLTPEELEAAGIHLPIHDK